MAAAHIRHCSGSIAAVLRMPEKAIPNHGNRLLSSLCIRASHRPGLGPLNSGATPAPSVTRPHTVALVSPSKPADEQQRVSPVSDRAMQLRGRAHTTQRCLGRRAASAPVVQQRSCAQSRGRRLPPPARSCIGSTERSGTLSLARASSPASAPQRRSGRRRFRCFRRRREAPV